MTSTNFNIGVSDARNSSRVLKPPGGGHSDIFGIYSQEQETPKAKNNHPRSTISEIFGGDNSVTNLSNQKTEEEQSDNQVPNNENEVPKSSITTPMRARVPPGGFSSGLW